MTCEHLVGGKCTVPYAHLRYYQICEEVTGKPFPACCEDVSADTEAIA